MVRQVTNQGSESMAVVSHAVGEGEGADKEEEERAPSFLCR